MFLKQMCRRSVMGFTLRQPQGFTLIELLLVLGILAVLLTIGTLGISQIYPQASQNTSVDLLLSAVKTQQLKAMTGTADATGNRVPHGLYFFGDEYVLFTGETYDPLATDNETLTIPDQLSLNTENLTDQQLIFEPGSGEVSNFSAAPRLTLIHTQTGDQKTLLINKMGVVSLTP